MNFNSFLFIGFFLCVYALYLVLPWKWQNRMLLLASYVFYGSWDWRFLSLIFISTGVDFVCGQKIHDAKDESTRRRFLTLSVVTNLAILGFFKYANFFTDSLVDLFAGFGITLSLRLAQIIVPVGISFYTFQTISYSVDIYRGKCQPVRSLADFALFVAYFPQLVAGPIERASVLLPQIIKPRTLRSGQFEDGCRLILTGYFLKTVVADNLAPFAERVFSNPDGETGLIILVGTYAAAFQIYGDFAGYTNIARGISKLMGIDLMKNFDRPYFATSPSDFWRRWHISLSSWLRDYLYIPLGGNRHGNVATYRNLLLTMLIGGLWHGAAWNFVAWGLFHGLILCLWRLFGWDQRTGASDRSFSWGRLIRVVAFFQLTCVGWMLFFVKDLGDVATLFQNLVFHFQINGLIGAVSLMVFAAPVVIYEFVAEHRLLHLDSRTRYPTLRVISYAVMLLMICFCGQIDAMNLFISSFSRVLLRRCRRVHYAVVAATLVFILVGSTTGAHYWLRSGTSGKRVELDRLRDAKLLVVGSSQLNGISREELGPDIVNLSHRGNGLRMMTETIRSALHRGDELAVVVFELGDVVVGSDPTRLRDHTFFEMGVSPWQFPGSFTDRLQASVGRFPLLRVPRMTPSSLIVQMRPELNAAARGLDIKREGNFVNNAAFRIDDLRVTNANTDQVEENLRALKELCELLDQRQLVAIALITPIDKSLRDLRSEDEEALLRRQINIVKQHPHIRLLDLFDADGHGFDRTMFEDSNHLNGNGRKSMCERIRNILADIGGVNE